MNAARDAETSGRMLRLEPPSPKQSETTAPIADRFGGRRHPYFRSARAAAKKKQPRAPRSTSVTRARLSFVLLLYFFGVVAVIALAPFRFSIPLLVGVGIGDWHDAVTIGLLVVPLGFLYPLTRPGQEPSTLRVCLLGLGLGGAIELGHVFESERFASVANIVACGAGASVGALVLRAVNQRIRESAKLTGRLSLEIPLVALIYLLIPLLVAASLPATDLLATVSLLPLGLFGARLISAVQEHHWRPAGVFRTRAIAIVAAAWATLGVFPVVMRNPMVGVGLIVLVALATAHGSSIPAVHGGSKERRFEAEVLRSAVPYLVAYFLIATFLPLADGIADWRIGMWLTGSGDLSQRMVRLLEPLAALTVLGYVLAEARGRRELRFRVVAGRIVVECACVAVLMEASRAFQRDASASVVQLALTIAAGVFGAGLYHKQRERVRSILIHRARSAPDASARSSLRSL